MAWVTWFAQAGAPSFTDDGLRDSTACRMLSNAADGYLKDERSQQHVLSSSRMRFLPCAWSCFLHGLFQTKQFCKDSTSPTPQERCQIANYTASQRLCQSNYTTLQGLYQSEANYLTLQGLYKANYMTPQGHYQFKAYYSTFQGLYQSESYYLTSHPETLSV